MKALVFIILVVGIMGSTLGQNQKFSTFQHKKFIENLPKDTLEYFAFSPRFSPGNLPPEFYRSQKLRIDTFQFKNSSPSSLTMSYPAPEFRMPVLSGLHPDNMPVFVPDSTVHYYLKIKRIPFVNPLSKK